MIFAAAFKVYSGFSGRRFQTDLRTACEQGMIGRVPAYNTVFDVMQLEELTPILHDMITTTAKPLAAVETQFAVDSTGIGTQCFYRHYSAKYGHDREKREFVAKPAASSHRRAPSKTWTRLYHYFQLNREEFLPHYHRRSNVETTFSTIERVIGDTLRSKTRVAQINEALLMVVCHNIRCLIHEAYELGIAPMLEQYACPAIQSDARQLVSGN
jgi:transposase